MVLSSHLFVPRGEGRKGKVPEHPVKVRRHPELFCAYLAMAFLPSPLSTSRKAMGDWPLKALSRQLQNGQLPFLQIAQCVPLHPHERRSPCPLKPSTGSNTLVSSKES